MLVTGTCTLVLLHCIAPRVYSVYCMAMLTHAIDTDCLCEQTIEHTKETTEIKETMNINTD